MRFAQINADRGIAPGATKGASLHLRGLASGLIALGHDVTTFSARAAEGAHPAPVRELAELENVTATTHDVVYERYSLGHRGGLDLARRRSLPFVLEVNAPLVTEAMQHRPGSVATSDLDVEAELLSSADLVITVSSGLAAWVGQYNDSVIALPNGFEPAWFQERPATASYDLAFIGHPKPWHGADRIVGVMEGLRSSGRAPTAVLIGAGPGADAVQDAANRAGIGAGLHVTGALEPSAASAMLSRARIGLAPYPAMDEFYFCPLKVVDYMAAGLAIVAADQGDIPAILGGTGLLFDPASDTDLLRQVERLLDAEDDAAELGAMARGRAHGSMTWTHVAERTVTEIATVATAERVWS